MERVLSFEILLPLFECDCEQTQNYLSGYENHNVIITVDCFSNQI